MIADFTAEGDQVGWTDFIKAAMPVMCGQDMEVPERMLNCICDTAGDQAAIIFNPGAATSGFKTEEEKVGTFGRKCSNAGSGLRPPHSFRWKNPRRRLPVTLG
ncbi:hypothetical protein MLD38_028733 [Melastoma candidum]|uniref:Uncharacterized protein n=1 Tax=Melastoma candidum TaxID=119954 RepID=A0ACB9N1Z1_9MYRT|nr:hypothetical protein MLD38_028733 [Melastoma candidum]